MAKDIGRKPSVLFLYMGLNRRQLLPEAEAGRAPDSAFRGYMVLRDSDEVEASFLDLGDLPGWASALKPFISATLLQLLHLRQAGKHDFVVTSDALLLGWAASLLGRAKWIYIPINSSVLIRRHAHHPLRLWSLKIMWSRFWRIAYITEGQKADFKKLGIKESKLRYLPYGIDTHFFAVPGEAPESGYVLSVGRDLGRDYPTLFAAAKRVPYRFIIATAPKNIPEDIDLPENVEVRYNVDAEGVRALYRGAACVAVFLKGEETTEGSDCTGQTVMLEALSAGHAIAVTDRAWIREYFEEGKDYLGVAPGDVAGATEALTRLMEDARLRAALTQSGREKVRTRYSSEAFADGLLELVRALDVRK